MSYSTGYKLRIWSKTEKELTNFVYFFKNVVSIQYPTIPLHVHCATDKTDFVNSDGEQKTLFAADFTMYESDKILDDIVEAFQTAIVAFPNMLAAECHFDIDSMFGNQIAPTLFESPFEALAFKSVGPSDVNDFIKYID
jgi:hypothetical protein